MNEFIPLKENLIIENEDKLVYSYCDEIGKPVHTCKEIFLNEQKIILYPYSVNRDDGTLRIPRISEIEFRGWSELGKIPSDFKKMGGYGFSTQRLKNLLYPLYRKFPLFDKLVIERYGTTLFEPYVISLGWGEITPILNSLKRDNDWNLKNRRLLINNSLSRITNKIQYTPRYLSSGELAAFFDKFDSFTKISARDIDTLSHIIEGVPTSELKMTTHFIKTRDKINTVFFESLIDEFEVLLNATRYNEEKWQNYFESNAWILTHLFPYQAILRDGKAYLGGKTIEDKEGRIVDFLFQSGIKDNLALLELKTPKTKLLKVSAYRNPDVYAITDELSGAVNQCLDQKDIFTKNFGLQEKMFDPKSILVIGRKDSLSESQSKCFELFRANQKHVDIVTFDELLAKLQSLHKILK